MSRRNERGTIYLLHFAKAFHHARHYLGWTKGIVARLDAHQDGKGSRIIAAIVDEGIGFEIARIWEGTRTDERKLHNYKASPRLCPICNPHQARHRFHQPTPAALVVIPAGFHPFDCTCQSDPAGRCVIHTPGDPHSMKNDMIILPPEDMRPANGPTSYITPPEPKPEPEEPAE